MTSNSLCIFWQPRCAVLPPPHARCLPCAKTTGRLLESLGSSHIDDFLLTEADRLTVSLNTLREQVARYTGAQPLHTTIR